MFWIVSVLLALVAALFVFWPLWRHHRQLQQEGVYGEAERRTANLVIFEERLEELERDLEEGGLDQDQFEALKHELERSLLRDVSGTALDATGTDVPAVQDRAADSWRSVTRLLPLGLVLVVLSTSYLFYEWFGFRHDLDFAELVERSRTAESPQEISELIYAFGEVIERDRENGWAWYFMARNLTEIGQLNEAAMAFDRASNLIENEGDRAVVLGQYAQILYLANDRQITQDVEQVIERAQRLDPYEQSVLQLLSTDAWMREDYQAAITYWQQMLTLGPNASDRAFLQDAIAQARQALAEQGGAQEAEPTGPRIEVALSLAPGIELAPDTRVFVSAQASARPGPPLAATVLTVDQLPATVTLSITDAVGPQSLADAEVVSLVATASLSGTANVQSGDYQGRIDGIELEDGEVRVQLRISEEVE